MNNFYINIWILNIIQIHNFYVNDNQYFCSNREEMENIDFNKIFFIKIENFLIKNLINIVISTYCYFIKILDIV